jgi:hypothetical protein
METLKSGSEALINKLRDDVKEIQDVQEYVTSIVRDRTEINPKSEEKYRHKVRKETAKTKREAEIGSIITKIPHYDSYFSPVEETSSLTQTTDDSKVTVSGRMKYVGKDDIYKYLMDEYAKYPAFFMTSLISLVRHLFDSALKLEENKVIHFDMKGKHIMVDEYTNEPKIINFGESFNEDMLENPEECFYMYEPNYTHWCLEIHIISYLLNKEKDVWRTEKVSSHTLEKILKDAIEGRTFKEYHSSREKLQRIMKSDENNKTNLREYMETLEDKTGEEVFNNLLETRYMWDMYSISLIIVSFFIETKLYKNVENPVFQKIEGFLEKIVTSPPNSRKTNVELKIEWISIIENMENQEWESMNDKIMNVAKEIPEDIIQQNMLLSRKSEIKNVLKSQKET